MPQVHYGHVGGRHRRVLGDWGRPHHRHASDAHQTRLQSPVDADYCRCATTVKASNRGRCKMADEHDWRYLQRIIAPALAVAPRGYLKRIQANLRADGMTRAVAAHDTAAIFGALIGAS